jgi:hypothetical protein
MIKDKAVSNKTLLNLMIVVTTALLMFILADNINRSLHTSYSDLQNYEKRKKYYEEVIVPANLDLYPARYYITIDQ